MKAPLIVCALLSVSMNLATPSASACTILVLTDPSRSLFCNNEDWLNPKSRIWFVPAGEGHLGCAYVGFDNGVTQGGLNTEGLAYDWVAGSKKEWKPEVNMNVARGLPCTRMLETCATVEDAIAFFRQHQEPAFSYAEIMVADKSGASAIIGYKNGQLQVERATQCRGFGYGGQTLERLLTTKTEPTLANGAAILRACLQTGRTGTKYSSIYDLRSREIFLFQFPEQAEGVTLNLAAELKKGAHFYEIPGLREQLTQAPKPLLDNMQRLFMEQFKPIPDPEPDLTRRVEAILRQAAEGNMRAEDYTSKFWKKSKAQAIQPVAEELKSLGKITSCDLAERKAVRGIQVHRYLVGLKDDLEMIAVLRIDLDKKDKIGGIQLESFQWK